MNLMQSEILSILFTTMSYMPVSEEVQNKNVLYSSMNSSEEKLKKTGQKVKMWFLGITGFRHPLCSSAGFVFPDPLLVHNLKSKIINCTMQYPPSIISLCISFYGQSQSERKVKEKIRHLSQEK